MTLSKGKGPLSLGSRNRTVNVERCRTRVDTKVGVKDVNVFLIDQKEKRVTSGRLLHLGAQMKVNRVETNKFNVSRKLWV